MSSKGCWSFNRINSSSGIPIRVVASTIGYTSRTFSYCTLRCTGALLHDDLMLFSRRAQERPLLLHDLRVELDDQRGGFAQRLSRLEIALLPPANGLAPVIDQRL